MIEQLSINTFDPFSRKIEKNQPFDMIVFPSDFLEKYTVLEKIGQGAQAIVFKIEELSSKRILAAKYYSTKESEFILKIKNEAELLKNLSFSSIISFNNLFSDEKYGVFIIVTEFFDSMELKALISKSQLSLEEKMNIFNQILETLFILHQNHVAHRDLNITNILINPKDLTIKVIDFGLSQHFQENECFSPSEGNHAYRAPAVLESNWVFGDLWGALLIFYSLIDNESYTTKKIISLMKQKNDDQDLNKIQMLLTSLAKKEEKEKLTYSDFLNK